MTSLVALSNAIFGHYTLSWQKSTTICESSSLLCEPQTSYGSFCFSFVLCTAVTLFMLSSLFSPYYLFLKVILLFLKYRWAVNMYIFTSNKIEFSWFCVMAQAVFRPFLIPEAGVHSQGSPVRDLEFVVNKISLGEDILRVIWRYMHRESYCNVYVSRPTRCTNFYNVSYLSLSALHVSDSLVHHLEQRLELYIVTGICRYVWMLRATARRMVPAL